MKKLFMMLALGLLTRALLAVDALPDGYQGLAWIAASGTQRIDTLYTPSQTDKFTVRFQARSVGTADYQAIYCARAGGTSGTMTCLLTKSGALRFDYNDGTRGYTGGGAIAENTDYILEMDGNDQSYVLNGQTVNNISTKDGAFTPGSTLRLFATQTDALPGSFLLRYFRVEDSSGETVVDLRPCRRLSDGAVGLYDLVRESFYGNSGTGTFETNEPELPAAYRRCAWIESSGTQWINTGFVPTCYDTVSTTVRFKDISAGNYLSVFCARKSGGTATFTCLKSNGDRFRFDRNGGTGDYGVSSVKPAVNTDYAVEMDAWTRGCKINGDIVATCGTTGGFTVGSPMVIFAAHQGTITDSEMTFRSSLRLYDFTISDRNGMAVVDLVPCRRVADGVVGLYDLVGNTFLVNGGTGVFTAPREALPAGFSACRWIESSGTQWVNTQYTPLCTDKVETRLQFRNISSGSYLGIFCARGAGNANTFNCIRNNGNKLRFDRNTGTGDHGTSGVVPVVDTDYLITMDAASRDCFVNGSKVAVCGTEGSFTVGSPFTIFAAHSGTIDDEHVSMKSSLRLYYFKVYDVNGNLACDCVPCQRDSDSEFGLYDLVNDRFLANAGTGAFTGRGVNGLVLIVR